MSKSLIEELSFYGAYHANFHNQLIHIVCVPALIWSLYIISGLTFKTRVIPLAIALFYCVYYIYLDRVVGCISSLFYLTLWRHADIKFIQNQNTNGWKWAIVAQILGWGIQVGVGHAIYEKRKPALFDSLFQAFSLAPLFVVYETLWMAFPSFQKELHEQVLARVKVIQAGLPH
jgi:uncharacterized membrane protein YGL010W